MLYFPGSTLSLKTSPVISALHSSWRKLPVALVLFAGLCVSLPAWSEALLQILPTRVVLDDKTRTASLTLVNQGNEDTSYRMFFRNIKMSETGQFNIIQEGDDVSGERFADSMLRFSPRRITIPARGKQTIRVVARKPQGLEKGEYRSHMVFRRLPAQNSVLDNADNPELQLAIRPVVEVTIPVIVRHEQPSANVSLSDLQIVNGVADPQEKPETLLSVAINRTGDRSLYGDLEVSWKADNGRTIRLGEAKGISVYYPNSKRIFKLPLRLTDDGSGNTNDQAIELSSGELTATFKENPIYGGNATSTASILR